MPTLDEFLAALRLVTLGEAGISITYYMLGRPASVMFSYNDKHHTAVSELLLGYKMDWAVEWDHISYDNDYYYCRVQVSVFTS